MPQHAGSKEEVSARPMDREPRSEDDPLEKPRHGPEGPALQPCPAPPRLGAEMLPGSLLEGDLSGMSPWPPPTQEHRVSP